MKNVPNLHDDFVCSQFEEEPVGLLMDGASSFSFSLESKSPYV
jgi:hypothetical protein